jgi:hypothetical protein
MDRSFARLAVAGLCSALVAACSGTHGFTPPLDEPKVAPDVQKAIPDIKKVAAEYHLTGPLEIAGPIEAPIPLSTPWEFCLKSASETRFKIALLYKGNAFDSAREATMGDHCNNQNYQAISN